MSATNWLRRASGLIVPRVGFSTAAWEFQNWGCCCEATFPPDGTCQDCLPGGSFPFPASMWVDISNVVDGTCSNCSSYNSTYQLTLSSCQYVYNLNYPPNAGPCVCDNRTGVVLAIAVTFSVNAEGDGCDVGAVINIYEDATATTCRSTDLYYSEVASSYPLDTSFDFTIPYSLAVTSAGSHICTGSGSIRLYS